ncbi:hypothetical protein PNA2_1521 [Pyrococcus sp. NA2]|uniref:HIT family protein n=1 Tax=Pyrococcus sp. (strain NA2) TaxID=342949 RepID=UPI000209B071|nr:HIT family protein [Pyrococcus sp. NA2]AEC52436.1 hypothetical protein PNA2_1521 [Pyrococcus sp. NA2]
MQCPFCNPKRENVIYETDEIRILVDNYPANPGHLLVVPRRHVTNIEELTRDEETAILKGIKIAMRALKEVLNPEGFNIGINIGEVAGQTVEHVHIHVIPRFRGDCKFPKGGIRKAVLDIPDENMVNKERWIKNRLSPEKIEKLRRAMNEHE